MSAPAMDSPEDTMGPDLRYACFKENKPDSCFRLGMFLHMHKEYVKSLNVFTRNCEMNKHGLSCMKVAILHIKGEGCPEDAEAAGEMFSKGCDYGCGESCHHMARFLRSGDIGGVKGNTKAYNFYEKGCANGFPKSCYEMGHANRTGVEGVVEKDIKKAFRYTLEACKGGDLPGCHNLSRMYHVGEGVEQNEIVAERIRKLSQKLANQMSYKNTQPIQPKETFRQSIENATDSS